METRIKGLQYSREKGMQWKKISTNIGMKTDMQLVSLQFRRTPTLRKLNIFPDLGPRHPWLRQNPCSGSVPREGGWDAWAAPEMNSGSPTPRLLWAWKPSLHQASILSEETQPDSAWVLTQTNSPTHTPFVHKTESQIITDFLTVHKFLTEHTYIVDGKLKQNVYKCLDLRNHNLRKGVTPSLPPRACAP